MSMNLAGRPEQQDDAVHPPPEVLLKRYQHADHLLGKRWVGLIVRALLGGPARFSELATAIGMLSDRMLSVRLGELEARGIVERRVDADVKPVRIEYALTAKGLALAPVIHEICRWADQWIGDEDSPWLAAGD